MTRCLGMPATGRRSEISDHCLTTDPFTKALSCSRPCCTLISRKSFPAVLSTSTRARPLAVNSMSAAAASQSSSTDFHHIPCSQQRCIDFNTDLLKHRLLVCRSVKQSSRPIRAEYECSFNRGIQDENIRNIFDVRMQFSQRTAAKFLVLPTVDEVNSSCTSWTVAIVTQWIASTVLQQEDFHSECWQSGTR